jgi:hypothetical protein
MSTCCLFHKVGEPCAESATPRGVSLNSNRDRVSICRTSWLSSSGPKNEAAYRDILGRLFDHQGVAFALGRCPSR